MKKYNGLFILVIIVAIAIYDVLVINQSGSEASISQFLIDWLYAYPIAGVVLGIFIGHLAWQMPEARKNKKKVIELELETIKLKAQLGKL